MPLPLASRIIQKLLTLDAAANPVEVQITEAEIPVVFQVNLYATEAIQWSVDGGTTWLTHGAAIPLPLPVVGMAHGNDQRRSVKSHTLLVRSTGVLTPLNVYAFGGDAPA